MNILQLDRFAEVDSVGSKNLWLFIFALAAGSLVVSLTEPNQQVFFLYSLISFLAFSYFAVWSLHLLWRQQHHIREHAIPDIMCFLESLVIAIITVYCSYIIYPF